MFRLIVQVAGHAAWFAHSLPGALAFLVAAAFPRRAQTRVLRRILRRNAASPIGRDTGFAAIRDPDTFALRLPLTRYADIAGTVDALARDGDASRLLTEPVRRLQPTSGTGGATKLLPWTGSLQREFLAAVHPWLAGLYLRMPSLFLGPHYWSISPHTPASRNERAAVPIGFADDAEYLGRRTARLARRLLAVPPDVARVEDPEAFAFLTLLFLVREASLRLISVWHPSFLTVLLDALPAHAPRLRAALKTGRIPSALAIPVPLRRSLELQFRPAPWRARALDAFQPGRPGAFQQLWPRLRVISCWAESPSDPGVARLRDAFPRAQIQRKGLAATEGIVTIPIGLGRRRPVAVRSHFFEFVDAQTGAVRRAWELVPGTEYTVVLTTGGGLYRYRLDDRVRVDGRFLRTPCLRFLGRGGWVSDRVGEKLDLAQVEAAIATARASWSGHLEWILLAPEPLPGGRAVYIAYTRAEPGDADGLAAWGRELERALQAGFHYRHARRTGQLDACRVFALAGAPDTAYHDRLARSGIRRGDIKVLPLSAESGWYRDFQGRFVRMDH